MTEELKPVARREIVTLCRARGLMEHDLRAEGPLQSHRRPSTRMNRTGHEFPKWFEILKYRTVRVVIMRCGVMQISGDPDSVANAGVLDEGEQVSDLNAAAARTAGVFDTRDIADRRIGSDNFPGRL